MSQRSANSLRCIDLFVIRLDGGNLVIRIPCGI